MARTSESDFPVIRGTSIWDCTARVNKAKKLGKVVSIFCPFIVQLLKVSPVT